MYKCWKCKKRKETILVTYPEGDKQTCLTCLREYQDETKKAFEWF